jgi:hypothetical protein
MGLAKDYASHHALQCFLFGMRVILEIFHMLRSMYWQYLGDAHEDDLARHKPAAATGGGVEMELVGHRGASTVAPENTMAAFQAALGNGYHAVEFDLQHTAGQDNARCEVIVIHDRTLARTATAAAACTLSMYQQLVLLYTPLRKLPFKAFADAVEVGSKSKGAAFKGEKVSAPPPPEPKGVPLILHSTRSHTTSIPSSSLACLLYQGAYVPESIGHFPPDFTRPFSY